MKKRDPCTLEQLPGTSYPNPFKKTHPKKPEEFSSPGTAYEDRCTRRDKENQPITLSPLVPQYHITGFYAADEV